MTPPKQKKIVKRPRRQPRRTTLAEQIEREHAKRRRSLLLDLANLLPDNVGWFWGRNRWGMFCTPTPQVSNAELLQLQNQLRAIWAQDPGDRRSKAAWLADANHILEQWFRASQRNRLGLRTFIPTRNFGLIANEINLHLQLVLGVTQWSHKMVRCKNPGCPAPYFLRYRDVRQQFCDVQECRDYGQRAHKLRWWHDNRSIAIAAKTKRKRGKR